jgi:hypothetical protein
LSCSRFPVFQSLRSALSIVIRAAIRQQSSVLSVESNVQIEETFLELVLDAIHNLAT